MTNKLKYFIGNWKMFGNIHSLSIIYQIQRFCVSFKKRNKVVMCVPNTLIHHFTSKLKSKFISIGSQNCHFIRGYGPYTGYVSASMLKKAGAQYVILGHSENRYNGENNKIIKKKIKISLDEKLNIIFCIGENLKENKSGKTFDVLKKQINECIDKKFNSRKILIAYEPVWSIGSGKVPNSKILEKIFKFIKSELEKKFKNKGNPVVLYGGSVNNINIKKFSKISQIDGFLIGGASQSSKKFIDIIKNYYK